jgi:hypothetical protein
LNLSNEPVRLGDDEPLLWNNIRGDVIAMFRDPVTWFSRARRVIYREKQFRMVYLSSDQHSMVLRQILPPPENG